jgi:hypothetical protein
VEATTVYDVFNSDCSEVLAKISASFRHSLVLPLAGVCAPPSIASVVGWERLGALGTVTLHGLTTWSPPKVEVQLERSSFRKPAEVESDHEEGEDEEQERESERGEEFEEKNDLT